MFLLKEFSVGERDFFFFFVRKITGCLRLRFRTTVELCQRIHGPPFISVRLPCWHNKVAVKGEVSAYSNFDASCRVAYRQ